MKNFFQIVPEDFFKPFTSKYKQIYVDCILLLFRSFQSEISYGVNREIVVKALTAYFEMDDDAISFDEVHYIRDAREKANAVIAFLKNCGWLEYEQEQNHQINIVLCEYAVPVVEAVNKVILEEEAEYQGIISQIHASLQNRDLYIKPYELIIKGVRENTERLISELKKLNASIKRHMDRQTNDMEAAQIIDHFFAYHKNIGSKAYLRMKTSENVSCFRSAVIEKIEEMMESTEIMERAVTGYMQVEQVEDREAAYDRIVEILLDVKAMFYRLDDIIEEIDRKHSQYMKNAVMRARFKLAAGNNTEGKLLRILDLLAEEINNAEAGDITEEAPEELQALCSVYTQGYLSPESLRSVPVVKNTGIVDAISEATSMGEEDRQLYKEALLAKNRARFSRKNINEYVTSLLAGKKQISVAEIPVRTRRDLIRIIYISIYAGNRANDYIIQRVDKRVKIAGHEMPCFDIIMR